MDTRRSGNESESENERAWAQANALLRGSPDRVILEGTRRRRQRVLLLVVGASVSLLTLGLLVGHLYGRGHPDRAGQSSADPLWRASLGLSSILLGLVALGLGFIQMRRDGLTGGRWRAPTSALTRAQKRDLRRQVLGRAPVAPVRLPLLRDLADRMTRLRSVILFYIGIMSIEIGRLLASPGPWRLAFVLALVLLSLIVLVQLRYEARAARRFLREHPTNAVE